MPWKSPPPPDPFEDRRRQLEEQQRLLAQKKQQLTNKLQADPAAAAKSKAIEPPVWRMEDDATHVRPADPSIARRRNLARQRQRDRFLFFVCFAVLFIVVAILLWVAYVHNLVPGNGT